MDDLNGIDDLKRRVDELEGECNEKDEEARGDEKLSKVGTQPVRFLRLPSWQRRWFAEAAICMLLQSFGRLPSMLPHHC